MQHQPDNCQADDSEQTLPASGASLVNPGDCVIPELQPGDFYLEGGELMVFTEQYHRRRGWCCENGCRHCPY